MSISVREAPPEPKYDLLFKAQKGSRVFDSENGEFISPTPDIAITNGKIAAIEQNIRWDLARRQPMWMPSNAILMPPVHDIHIHNVPGTFWCRGDDVTDHDINPGAMVESDAGSAGRINFEAYREHTMRNARKKLFAALHIAPGGLTVEDGESYDLRHHLPKETAAIAKEHSDVIVAIKVRLGKPQAKASTWKEALNRAKAAADEAGLPVMVHIANGPKIEDVLNELRKGDIVTHCNHGLKARTIIQHGNIHPAVLAARNRGVIFDTGHGSGSFNADVADKAISKDFLPDTISSDQHIRSRHGPAYDQCTNISKLIALGIPMTRALQMVTRNSAAAIGQPENTGTLMIGSPATLSVLIETQADDAYQFVDSKDADGKQRIFEGKTRLQKLWGVYEGKLQ